MKTNKIYTSVFLVIGLASLTFISACTKEFLKPDPLSLFEPDKTFSTRAGVEATTYMMDRHLRTYWSYLSTRDISVPMNTEYMLSDLAVSGKTDDGAIFADVATRLTLTEDFGLDVNMISFFWGETYNGIKYANTITSFIIGRG